MPLFTLSPFVLIAVQLLNMIASSVLLDECQQSWDVMNADRNFQYWQQRVSTLCFIRYQNGLSGGSTGPAACQHWEYDSFCLDDLRGQPCTLQTGFVEIPTCVPYACPDSALSGIVGSYFNSSTLDCSKVPSRTKPVIAAIVSTILVLTATAVLVFLIRPPRSVRESTRLAKTQAHLSSLSGS